MENNRRLPGDSKIAFCIAAPAEGIAGAWLPRRFCRTPGMKLNMAAAIGVILASSLCARTADGVGRPQVLVCMERNADPLRVIPRAQALTTWMFDQIGVALVWRTLKHCPEETRPVVILLSLDTRPFEGVHIRVFYDRVRTVTGICPLPVLLAHVLAHEIGHILQGTDGHSASGVMKSHWDWSDYSRMAREPLPFTDLDIGLIHDGLDARTERQKLNSPPVSMLGEGQSSPESVRKLAGEPCSAELPIAFQSGY